MTLQYVRQKCVMLVVLAATMTTAAGVASAQESGRGGPRLPQVPAVPGLNSDARQVRDELNALFEQYPPTLRTVLRTDPTLLTNAAYLAPYPALAVYLGQHPEIPHNPAYFVGTSNFDNNFYRDTPSSRIAQIIEPLALSAVVIVLICILGWMLRGIMNHRRWLRTSKLQTDMQNKLLERFTSNEEMLAFIGTAAGQRFLESASVVVEPGPRNLSAPIGRMLWSMQLGVVMLVTGFGIHFVAGQLSEDVVTGFQVTGGIVMALGIGFILSALGSYLLSRRLGLMDPAPTPTVK
jgi:hypothetical protein